MPAIDELWNKLPKFVKNNRTVRAEIKHSSEVVDAYASQSEWRKKPIDKANMITSEMLLPASTNMHNIILDIDYEAQLVPSSTPGHYHLFLDKVMPWPTYEKLLKALAEAGIIQWGFYEGAVKRKATSVRLPWIKKGDVAANALEPDIEKKRIEAAIRFHEDILIKLKEKILGKNPCEEDGLIDKEKIVFGEGKFYVAPMDGEEWVTIGTTNEEIKFHYEKTANPKLEIKKSQEIDPDLEW